MPHSAHVSRSLHVLYPSYCTCVSLVHPYVCIPHTAHVSPLCIPMCVSLILHMCLICASLCVYPSFCTCVSFVHPYVCIPHSAHVSCSCIPMCVSLILHMCLARASLTQYVPHSVCSSLSTLYIPHSVCSSLCTCLTQYVPHSVHTSCLDWSYPMTCSGVVPSKTLGALRDWKLILFGVKGRVRPMKLIPSSRVTKILL